MGLDEQLTLALAIPDLVERYHALEAFRVQVIARLDAERAQVVRDLARAEGHGRTWGPRAGREFNWKAAGRKLGISGDWAKHQADVPAEPAAAVASD